MKAIVLGGESKQSNEQWTQELGEALKPQFDETIVINYQHWNSSEDFNFAEEKEKLERIIRETATPYAIIAKSAGSALSIALIQEKRAKPVYCVFAGIPLREDGTSKYGLETALMGYNIPTIILQNLTERFMRPEKLCLTLARLRVKSCDIVAGQGNEHIYSITQIVKTAQGMNNIYR